jgi:ribosomal protein S18 acetylase RimI-like enzyme
MGSTVSVIVRVTPGVHWHALEDDVVVGKAHALHRPDGRVLVSVDSWRDDVFESLAEAMARDLDRPLYTVVDDDDREHLGRWSRLGFVDNRREDEYAVEIAPEATGLGAARLPPGFSLTRVDRADEDRVRLLDQRLRQDVPGYDGWVNTPADFHRWIVEHRVYDPTTYLIAVHAGEYAGLIRIGRSRRPRLGLVGVLPADRRRGLARALLAAAFRPLHERGVARVLAEVDETNLAAKDLLLGIGAHRTGGAVELVRPPPAR